MYKGSGTVLGAEFPHSQEHQQGPCSSGTYILVKEDQQLTCKYIIEKMTQKTVNAVKKTKQDGVTERPDKSKRPLV